MVILFKIIVFLRRIFERISWELFKQRNWVEAEDLQYWNLVRDSSPEKFSYTINKLQYKSDPHSGLFDFSFPISEPQYFFKNLKHGRDCDDWSRIWVCYYKYHRTPIEEWVVTSRKGLFKYAHFVAVVKVSDGYKLLNYKIGTTVHKTVEDALEELSTWKDDVYSKPYRLQCRYKKY